MTEYDANGMLRPEFVKSRRVPRPDRWMENPYIGKDGRDYHSFEALQQANAEHNEGMFPKKVDLTHVESLDRI